jgi:iron complex outermembrane receptor protein
VVKGPSTALFGFNAVSGVINIVTYNPLHEAVNTLSVTGGSFGTIEGSAVATLQDSGRWGLRLSGSAGLDNDFSSPIPIHTGALARVQNSRGAVNANGVMQVNEHVQFTLDLSHSETLANVIGPTYAMIQDRHLVSSGRAQLNADTSFGLVQLSAYTNWIEQKSDDGLFAMDFADRTTVVQLQDVLRIGESHIVRAALEYRHNEVNTAPFTGAAISYEVVSASAMWNWAISPTLAWTNAVRLDHLTLERTGALPAGYPFRNSDWDRALPEWSFNSGLVWKATAEDTVRLMASRGVQLPSLGNFGGFVAATPFFNSSGAPNVNAAVVMNYELGWDRRIEPLQAALRTALFWQKTTSIIGLVGGFIPGPPFYSVGGNIGNSDAIGGEISLTGRIAEDWHWDLGYRLETVKDKFTPLARAGFAFSDYQHTTPRHQVKAGLGWRSGNWEIDTALYYQSRTDGLFPLPAGATGLMPVGAYANMDARIGYRVNKAVTLALSGDNLLAARQQQHAAPAVERRVLLKMMVQF